MSALEDVSHTWGQDLDLSPSGDVATVTGHTRTVQRIVRRLMTTKTRRTDSAYPWRPDYGAGLGERVGQIVDARSVQAVVLAQMLAEPSVSRNPAPIIAVSQNDSGVFAIDVTYQDRTGAPNGFVLDVGGQ